MSKNKYSLPFKKEFFVEFGGTKQSNSHSWNIPNQRYAYDLEIRKDNVPYFDDYLKVENYYSYNEDVLSPADGIVFEIRNKYKDTRVDKNRKIVCDADDVRGNFIIIKHKYNECSMIAHMLKDSFKVKVGDVVKRGQVIGKVGNSGNSNGPHIHFQIQKGVEDNALGVPITFKNIIIKRNNKRKYRRYIKKGDYVINKK